ncbi:MAG: arginyltransferase [Alcaligenaceae bacterium]|nr:arginyltransferase [Alcaligenaceae bacterium]
MTKSFDLHLSPPGKCSYLEDMQSSSQIIVPPHEVNSKYFGPLLRQGFRRSGAFVYRPHCGSCSACLSLRVEVAKFEISKRFKRIISKNRHLQCRQLPLRWDDEHVELYMRYQTARHGEQAEASRMRADYRDFILNSYVNSALLEYRDQDNQLKMVSLIDIIDDGISAVYTFYDPEDKNSLGHYGILCQVDLCKISSKQWLYLGYWVEDCSKLNYKIDYQPAEIFRDGAWIPYNQL